MTQASTIASNAESGRNSAVQGVTGALGSLRGSSGVGTSQDIHSIASNVRATITLDGKIISAASTVAGIGFISAALFKIHQHKQNPQMISVR